MNSSKIYCSDSERKQIGKRIRKFREAKHISQQTLADKLGLDRSAVCKWESGKTKPSIEHMKLLADHLDVSVESISNGSTPTIKPKGAIERGKAFVDAFLMTHGDVPLSSFLDNDKMGGEQGATGDSESKS